MYYLKKSNNIFIVLFNASVRYLFEVYLQVYFGYMCLQAKILCCVFLNISFSVSIF